MLFLIEDTARSCSANMAIDELFFNSFDGTPILRTYSWDNAYTSIGYFQKSRDFKTNFVRRLTGGLAVEHFKDLSYSLICSSENLNIYNQFEIYKTTHLSIKSALEKIGMETEILQKSPENKKTGNICVETFVENDLIFNREKIVGSCLRRRKNKILIQGSIHKTFDKEREKSFSLDFAKAICKKLNVILKKIEISSENLKKAKEISLQVYSNEKWNYKF
jgi:lipoate-protein ligase A